MQSQTLIQWPPPYQVRRSSRAKNISIAIKPKTGLELVLPHWANEKQGLKFMRENREWVLKHYADWHEANQKAEQQAEEFPETISFPCLDKAWQVVYQFSLYQRPVLRELSDQLWLIGKEEDFSYFYDRVLQWLRHQAHLHLAPLFEEISQECDLAYAKLTFRGQTTRWGSCSSSGDISLNYKLLFLPFNIVRYVMVHELCHTVHMDHSKRFWSLVGRFDKNYRRHVERLKHLERQMPGWLE